MPCVNQRTGEPVKLSLVTADASAGVPLVITDANGTLRPLQSWERLLIDSISANVAQKTDVTDGGATGSTLLSSFSTTASEFHVDENSLSVTVGTTPTVTAIAGAVEIIGAGRIINGKTQGVRPNWRELLTPGGTQ